MNDNKDIEIEYLKKKVDIYKNFGENMIKFSDKNLKDFSFYIKLNLIMNLCSFLLGVVAGLMLMILKGGGI